MEFAQMNQRQFTGKIYLKKHQSDGEDQWCFGMILTKCHECTKDNKTIRNNPKILEYNKITLRQKLTWWVTFEIKKWKKT